MRKTVSIVIQMLRISVQPRGCSPVATAIISILSTSLSTYNSINLLSSCIPAYLAHNTQETGAILEVARSRRRHDLNAFLHRVRKQSVRFRSAAGGGAVPRRHCSLPLAEHEYDAHI